MKRCAHLLCGAVFLVALNGVAFGQGVTNTDHDFSGETWNTTGQICVVCHTPHHGTTTVPDVPLWNHELSTATYTVYSSSTLDATVGQPDGSSKACLSCHDGTVAVDNFGGQSGGTFFVTGGALLGTDLSNDHPVSFIYDAALAATDGALHDPATTNSGLGGTIDQDMLFSTKVQCASCHNPHDDSNGAFLIKSNASSALCLTCHNQ